MSLDSQDNRGRYRVLHEFVDIGAGQDGRHAWCRLRQVRQYADGGMSVADGPLLAMNDQTPELRAVMKIYAESKFALECRLEAPK